MLRARLSMAFVHKLCKTMLYSGSTEPCKVQEVLLPFGCFTLRLSMGSNLWVQVPICRYLHLPNPKPASSGFWRVGNPNPWV